MGAGDTNPAHRSLRDKLKRAQRAEPVDGERYAGYRGNIREASVEIVRPNSSGEEAEPTKTPNDLSAEVELDWESKDEPSLAQQAREILRNLTRR